MKRAILIFGGAGFIGANWAHWLLMNTDAEVHVFDNLSRPGVRHNLAWLRGAGGPRLKITVGDVRDAELVETAVRDATEIYHLAAQVAVTTSVADPALDFDVNLRGTFNILEAVRTSEHHPFLLFTSTNKVYGDLGVELVEELCRYRFRSAQGISEQQPLDFHSPYGCSKGAADQYVRDYARIYGLSTVVFRMSCIAGPRQFGAEDQGWVAHFLYSALEGKRVTLYGSGKQVRDVLHVGDLMRAFEAVRQHPAAISQVFNVGGGEANTTSLLELIGAIEQLTRKSVACDTADFRPGDQLVYVTDHSKLTRMTGWTPRIAVNETLRSIHEWWKQDPALITGAGRPSALVAQEVVA